MESRGFGFVRFSTEQDAEDAKKGMDGQELDGNVITVNIANNKKKDKTEYSGSGHRGGYERRDRGRDDYRDYRGRDYRDSSHHDYRDSRSGRDHHYHRESSSSSYRDRSRDRDRGDYRDSGRRERGRDRSED